MAREKIVNIICFVVALLFSYVAVSKLLDIQKFQVELSKSPMLTSFALPLSYGVPLVEIVLSLQLFTIRFRLAGLYMSYSLMTIFSSYIVVIMNYSYHVPCSCGGILQKIGWREHLVFNIAIVVIILTAIIIEEKSRARQRESLSGKA